MMANISCTYDQVAVYPVFMGHLVRFIPEALNIIANALNVSMRLHIVRNRGFVKIVADFQHRQRFLGFPFVLYFVLPPSLPISVYMRIYFTCLLNTLSHPDFCVCFQVYGRYLICAVYTSKINEIPSYECILAPDIC